MQTFNGQNELGAPADAAPPVDVSVYHDRLRSEAFRFAVAPTRFTINTCFGRQGLAHDVYMGVGLFIGIILIAVGFFAAVIPYADGVAASLAGSRSLGTGLDFASKWIDAVRTPIWYHTVVFLPLTEVLLVVACCADPGIVWGGVENQDEDEGTHRCTVCKVDVLDYDHHCSIIGACIGKYTLPWFATFLTVASELLFVAFFLILPVVAHSALTGELLGGKSLWRFAPVAVLVAVIYLGGYTGMLAIFYILAIGRGEYSLHRRRALLGKLEVTPDGRKRYVSPKHQAWTCKNMKDCFSRMRHLRMSLD
jgi:hypothetical protein